MVTGMSGGGKSTAMRLLEDMGYYCVDNLPIQLIDKFVELLSTPNTEITKVAIGVDVIDTFTFRALINNNDIGMAAASGFFQSVLCFVTVVFANRLVSSYDKDYALF